MDFVQSIMRLRRAENPNIYLSPSIAESGGSDLLVIEDEKARR